MMVKYRGFLSAALLLTLATVTACGGGGDGGETSSSTETSTATPAATAVGTPTGSATSATIGAAGGTVSTPDGKMTVTIPAGALAADTVIGIEPLTNMAHGKVGAAYRLTPHGQRFLQPVTLTFAYGDQDPSEFLGAAFQTAEGFWQWAGEASVDTTARTASIATSHFSDWSLVEGIQIIPGSAAVIKNGTVNLRATPCYQHDPNNPDPRGYDCGDAEGPVMLNPVDEWAVYVPSDGNSAAAGTVRPDPSGKSAVYTAPAIVPSPNRVVVTARVHHWRGETRLVRANIYVVPDSWRGTASSESTVTSPSSETRSSGSGEITWSLTSLSGNIALYQPTGPATIRESMSSMDGNICSGSSNETIVPSGGQLAVDYNSFPPKYWGFATAPVSPINWTCTNGQTWVQETEQPVFWPDGGEIYRLSRDGRMEGSASWSTPGEPVSSSTRSRWHFLPD